MVMKLHLHNVGRFWASWGTVSFSRRLDSMVDWLFNYFVIQSTA